MKKLLFISLLGLFATVFGSFNDNNSLLISTYDNHNAFITAETSDFEDNIFTITLKVDWINNNLKPVKNKTTVLAINAQDIKIYPENAVNITQAGAVTLFSNEEVQITLGANPNFEGGEVTIELPLVAANDLESAQLGHWREVFYEQPKKLVVKYTIDGSKIKDVFAPEIIVTSPLVNKNKNEEIPIIDEKMVDFYVTAVDKGGVKWVKINGRKAKNEFVGEYHQTISLFTGINTIKITSEDNAGNISEIKYDLICTHQYELKTNGGIYYAILIAENDYKDPSINNLANPISDAKKLKKVLVENYSFEDDYVYIMENPTRAEIIQEFEGLNDYIGEDDNLIIFYAGHGYWDAYKEIGYWLPSDASMGDKSNWLRNSTVKDYIGAVNSRHTLMITDACFGGSIFQTRAIEGRNVVAYQKIYEMPSRKGMTSGTLKEVPDESIFLQTLVKRLEQNDDRYLPVSKLFNSMRDAILNNSPNVPQFGTIQGVGDEGGEFIFIKRIKE